MNNSSKIIQTKTKKNNMKKLAPIILLILVSCGTIKSQNITFEGKIVHTYANKKGKVLAFDIYDVKRDSIFKICNVYEFDIRFIQNKIYTVESNIILCDKRSKKKKERHTQKNNKWERNKRYVKYQYNFKNIWS